MERIGEGTRWGVLTDTAFDILTQAAIRQSCVDLIKAERVLNGVVNFAKKEKAVKMVKECEDYFSSDFYNILTKSDGKYEVKLLKDIALTEEGNVFLRHFENGDEEDDAYDDYL